MRHAVCVCVCVCVCSGVLVCTIGLSFVRKLPGQYSTVCSMCAKRCSMCAKRCRQRHLRARAQARGRVRWRSGLPAKASGGRPWNPACPSWRRPAWPTPLRLTPRRTMPCPPLFDPRPRKMHRQPKSRQRGRSSMSLLRQRSSARRSWRCLDPRPYRPRTSPSRRPRFRAGSLSARQCCPNPTSHPSHLSWMSTRRHHRRWRPTP